LLTFELEWTDAHVIEAFEQFQRIATYFPYSFWAQNYATQVQQFAKGDAAFMFDGSWHASILAKSPHAHKFRFCSYPCVGGVGDGYQFADLTSGFVFSANSTPAEIDIIGTFIETFFSKETQLRCLRETGWIPSRRDIDISQVDVSPLTQSLIQTLHHATGVHKAYDLYFMPNMCREIELRGIELLRGEWSAHQYASYLKTIFHALYEANPKHKDMSFWLRSIKNRFFHM
jgi:ABC-type glycerol-3-phosphate transport system substrate-binding protein